MATKTKRKPQEPDIDWHDPFEMMRAFEAVVLDPHMYSYPDERADKHSWGFPGVIEPLLAAGYATTEKTTRYSRECLESKPTEAGLRWWYQQRLDYEAEIDKEHAARLSENPSWKDHWKENYYALSKPEDLKDLLYGMGIGGEFCARLDHPRSKRGAIFQGLLDGLFEFGGHYDYYPRARSYEEVIRVRLTEKGFHFYHNLKPIFEEVW